MEADNTEALDRAEMQQLVAGHEAALNGLMERHAAPIFHFLYRMLGSEEDANDLAQETFARVYRARDSYRPDQKFGPWLYTIAANLARNHLRWRARHPTVSLDAASETTGQALENVLPAEGSSPPQTLEAAERAQAVRAAVRQLPEDMRAAIVLCEWEELSVADAASALHTTPKAVESCLYRARKQLRQRLAKWL